MPKPTYLWFPDVRRFRDRGGRFVAQDTVADHVDEITNRFAARLKTDAKELIADFSEEKFAAWATRTRREIKNMHNAVTVIALGGKKAAMQFTSTNAQTWAEAEALMANQLRFFDRFLFQTAVGAVPFDGRFADRVSMYGEAGYQTYENAVRLREMNAGMDQEMRVLNPGSEHCEDCLIEAGKDWQPTGTLRRIGDSKCRGRCRCRFKYRKT
jgi:hypothetical protein